MTDIEVLTIGILRPPMREDGIVCHFLTDLPIELGHNVINPTLFEPEEDVGIEIIIVLHSGLCSRPSLGVAAAVAPYAKGRDAKFYPWFDGLDGVVEFLNHHIHVVSPPVVFVGISTRKLAERLLIGEVLSCDAIGVEVVIEMDAIDIITSDHIGYHSAEMLARLVVSRVEIILLAVFHEQLRLAAIDMRGGELRRCESVGDSVGVEPHMYIDASLMCLGADEGERVVGRAIRVAEVGAGRPFALFTGEPMTPRLQFRSIEGVRSRADLEDDHVHVERLNGVKQLQEFLTLEVGMANSFSAGPIDIGYGSYPCRTHLAFGKNGLAAFVCLYWVIVSRKEH